MSNHKKISILICTFLYLFISTHNSTFANTRENAEMAQKKREWLAGHQTNAWTWLGAGLVFASQELQPYIQVPTVEYELGLAKSLYHVRQRDFWYTALILDFAYSNRDLKTDVTTGLDYDSLFYFSNTQWTLGYEQSLGQQYFAAFLEAGVVFQLRTLGIRETSTLNLADYSYIGTVGGTFNGGINFTFYKDCPVSYALRVGMNLMIGVPKNQVLNYNGDTANANALTYGPFLAFTFRV